MHPFNQTLLRHSQLSSTCANSSQTVIPPTHCKLKLHPLDPTPSTHSRVTGEPPALSLLGHISSSRPPSSPHLPLTPPFPSLPDVEACRHAGNVIVMQSDSPGTVNIDSGGGCCLCRSGLIPRTCEGAETKKGNSPTWIFEVSASWQRFCVQKKKMYR